eukprot:SAG31_NODE_4494_length_3187_cov_13.919365_3_plen_69_part_00
MRGLGCGTQFARPIIHQFSVVTTKVLAANGLRIGTPLGVEFVGRMPTKTLVAGRQCISCMGRGRVRKH